ncbi:YciI family protein [Rubellimicrobium arenae]|uniref:YciI family protein n=1 Tax=Rubellimicrobium arenae TaxID=2817372 RepID=UPI001B30A400|nr:YciI family protein [Rubellimicrobium arenae]
MATYAYRILPPRPDFAATIQPAEMEVMGRHFAHLQDLHGRGVIRYVGRAANGDYGFCVFDAEDDDAARAVAGSDPAVAEGLMTLELHPFMVVFDAPAR